MTRSRATSVAAAVLVVTLTPSLAFAGQHLKGDKPPAAGHWTVKAGPSISSKTGGGSFVVTKSHKVKKLQIKLKHAAVADCGVGQFTVSGSHQLHKIYNGNGEDEWAIGKYVAGQSPSYDPVKTSVKGGGKTYNAKIEMSFNSTSDTGTRTYGYLSVKGAPGGLCFLDFTFKKG